MSASIGEDRLLLKKKLDQRKIEEICRLRRDGFSYGEISMLVGVSKSTAYAYGKDMYPQRVGHFMDDEGKHNSEKILQGVRRVENSSMKILEEIKEVQWALVPLLSSSSDKLARIRAACLALRNYFSRGTRY